MVRHRSSSLEPEWGPVNGSDDIVETRHVRENVLDEDTADTSTVPRILYQLERDKLK